MPSDVLFDPILQSQIEFLEDELFVVFNSKNNSDDFDISCGKETQNGSYFFRACEPVFLSLARQKNSLEWRAGREALLTTENIKEIFILHTSKYGDYPSKTIIIDLLSYLNHFRIIPMI